MKTKQLTKKDFNNILTTYNIGDYQSHKYIFTGGNLVYKLKTTKGTFILKVYSRASLDFVKSQIGLLEFLRKTKVTTPKIILNNKGHGLLIYDKRKIAIQEFAKGREVQYPNKRLAKDMGNKYGLLDKTLMKYPGRINIKEGEGQYKLVKWKIKHLEGFNLDEESNKVFNDIKKLNKKKFKRGLIHGDLCEGNFLIQRDKISAIIDWDDAHFTDIVYEIVIPIAQNFTTRRKVRKNLIKIFIKEYEKFIKLNNEEKRAIHFFAKHRLLEGASWCYDLIEKHPGQKKELMSWIKINIDKYKAFDKISLEEFSGLMKED